MENDSYVKLLDRYISTYRHFIGYIEDDIDELRSNLEALEEKVYKMRDELDNLYQERARSICPFKIGSYVKGWNKDDMGMPALVTDISNINEYPYWAVKIKHKGIERRIYDDWYKLEPVYISSVEESSDNDDESCDEDE